MRFFKTGLAIVCGLILTATGLWATGASDSDDSTAAAMDKETVFDPASGITWTAPEYGGTLTWGANGLPKNTDLWAPGGWTPHLISGVNDKQSIRAGPASSELPVVVGVAGARSDRLD